MRCFALRALAGALAAIVALEIVLRLLPVSTATLTGYHVDPDLLTYPPNHQWRVATGWDLRNAQALRSNNYGFVADIDFLPDPTAVALIGDSYVEASMLPASDRPGAQLQRMLPDRRVYALGGPGSSLLDYGQRIRWAAQTLRVRDFVLLLERFDARQSICGSGNVHSRCLNATTLLPETGRHAPPGAVKRLLRHSALAQYVAGQIGFRPEAFLRAMFRRVTPDSVAAGQTISAMPPSAQAVAQTLARVDAVVDNFFATVRPFAAGRLVVLVDGQRTGKDTKASLVDLERQHLIQQLRKGGAKIVDLEPVYTRHSRQSKRSLDVGPYDGHLNAMGVALVMRQAAGVLNP